MISSSTRPQSSLPKFRCLSSSLRISPYSFLLWCRLETSGLFWVYKPASNERPQFSITGHPAMPGMTQARIPAEILAKLAIITSSHYDRFTVAHVSLATFAYLPTFRQRFPYQGSRLLRVPYSSPVALHSS